MNTDNISGVKKVSIISTLDAKRLIKRTSLTENSNPGEFFDYDAHQELDMIMESGGQKIIPNGGGIGYELKLTLSKVNEAFIKRVAGKPFGIMAKIETHNGDVMVNGSLKEPAVISIEGNTGSDFNSLNQMNVMISWATSTD